jgi:hypothetical protein
MGKNQESFEYTVLPSNQVGKPIECSTTFKGTVTVKSHPSITVKNAPANINLDNAAKVDFQVNVKAAGIKSNNSLSLALEFDKSLDSNERPIFDLSQALVLDKNSLSVNANERMFTVNLDPAKMKDIVVKKIGAKSKRTELIFVAVLTARNDETKMTYSENLVINVTRSLPVETAPAAKTSTASKAGQK